MLYLQEKNDCRFGRPRKSGVRYTNPIINSFYCKRKHYLGKSLPLKAEKSCNRRQKGKILYQNEKGCPKDGKRGIKRGGY
jgi:hypothetical protein